MTAIERDTPLPAFLDDAPITEEQIAAEQAAGSDVDTADDDLPQRWRIEGDRQAEWCLRKLAAIEAEGDAIAEQAEQWVLEIQRWADERQKPLNSDHAFFESKLTEWLRTLREADPKVKSKTLPSGTVSSRTVQPRVDVIDVDAVEAWANAAGVYDEVIKVATTVRLPEFKKAVTVDADGFCVRDKDTGQPVPGVNVHPGGVSYSVKVSGG
jgi:phage host-nuclease inhibitor protein Gam